MSRRVQVATLSVVHHDAELEVVHEALAVGDYVRMLEVR